MEPEELAMYSNEQSTPTPETTVFKDTNSEPLSIDVSNAVFKNINKISSGKEFVMILADRLLVDASENDTITIVNKNNGRFVEARFEKTVPDNTMPSSHSRVLLTKIQ